MPDPINNPTPFYTHKWSQDWKHIKTCGPASRHVIDHVLQLIAGLRFTSVFDVGCGGGTILSHIHDIYPHVSLAGSELIKYPLTSAKKILPHATFYQNDITKSPPTKTTHDLVLCIDVLEHIENDQAAITNLKKLTGKYLLIVVPLGPLREIEYQKVGHVHGYSKFEIDWKLTRAGFKLLTYHQWGFPFYNLYRRLLHFLPAHTHGGKITFKKLLAANLFYFLLSFSFTSHPWGQRYIALYKLN